MKRKRILIIDFDSALIKALSVYAENVDFLHARTIDEAKVFYHAHSYNLIITNAFYRKDIGNQLDLFKAQIGFDTPIVSLYVGHDMFLANLSHRILDLGHLERFIQKLL